MFLNRTPRSRNQISIILKPGVRQICGQKTGAHSCKSVRRKTSTHTSFLQQQCCKPTFRVAGARSLLALAAALAATAFPSRGPQSTAEFGGNTPTPEEVDGGMATMEMTTARMIDDDVDDDVVHYDNNDYR